MSSPTSPPIDDENTRAQKFREETVKRLQQVKIKLRMQKELIKQLRASSTRLILGIVIVTFAYSIYDLYNKTVILKRENEECILEVCNIIITITLIVEYVYIVDQRVKTSFVNTLYQLAGVLASLQGSMWIAILLYNNIPGLIAKVPSLQNMFTYGYTLYTQLTTYIREETTYNLDITDVVQHYVINNIKDLQALVPLGAFYYYPCHFTEVYFQDEFISWDKKLAQADEVYKTALAMRQIKPENDD